ncbi:hypothetical protein DL96DRAFT_1616779 [Flagelloscypha sp. PMI_526]|nr:hypothetical protein DL96DRAFT_1616779 [Flagelloscypha sp. PMI_526]
MFVMSSPFDEISNAAAVFFANITALHVKFVSHVGSGRQASSNHSTSGFSRTPSARYYYSAFAGNSLILVSSNAGVHIAALRQKLPMLRRAVLRVPAGLEDTNGTFTATHIVDFLEVAPRLEEITLRNALPITHFRLLKAAGIHGEAWRNVRKFSTAERLDCDTIRDVLSRLPNLNVFGSTFSIPPNGLNLPSLSNAAINARNLTTLALRQPDELGRDNSCTFDCLSRGSLPNLQHFVMPTPLVEDHLNNLLSSMGTQLFLFLLALRSLDRGSRLFIFILSSSSPTIRGPRMDPCGPSAGRSSPEDIEFCCQAWIVSHARKLMEVMVNTEMYIQRDVR